MDKKQLRVALKILKEVTVKFPNTKKFVDDVMEEECQKERITANEVIFYKSRSKELAQKKYFFCFALSMLTLFRICIIDGTNY